MCRYDEVFRFLDGVSVPSHLIFAANYRPEIVHLLFLITRKHRLALRLGRELLAGHLDQVYSSGSNRWAFVA